MYRLSGVAVSTAAFGDDASLPNHPRPYLGSMFEKLYLQQFHRLSMTVHNALRWRRKKYFVYLGIFKSKYSCSLTHVIIWRSSIHFYWRNIWPGISILFLLFLFIWVTCHVSSVPAFKWQINITRTFWIILAMEWFQLQSMCSFHLITSYWCVYIQKMTFFPISWRSPVLGSDPFAEGNFTRRQKSKTAICFVAFVSVPPNRPHPSSWR